MRFVLFFISLAPLLLLGGAVGFVLDVNNGYIRNPLAICFAVLICVLHALVLIFFSARPTRLLGSLTKAMGFVSAFYLMHFAYVSNPYWHMPPIVQSNTTPLILKQDK